MSKEIKELVPYIAGVVSILFGVVLLWWPPGSLAADPGAVGIALSFITGGLAALGVTVAVPRLMELARQLGFKEGRRAIGRDDDDHVGGHPDVGHGHIHLQAKNKADVVLAAKEARKWGDNNLDQTKEERFEFVNAMEDPFDPATGNQRPKGALVIVEVLLPKTGRHSVEAHDRMITIAGDMAQACRDYFHENKVQHWCCWSDH